MLSAYVSLAKPRILALLLFVAAVSAAVASGGQLAGSRLWPLLLAGAMASVGAAYLNNYIDRDIDAIMPRTRNRVLPAGRADPQAVLLIGVALIVLSLAAAMRLGVLVTVFVLLGALIYVLLYTAWLKRRSALNIVLGGLAGSCAVLAGWFAINSELSFAPLALALVLFLWTPAHFWSFALAHEESYRRAGVPMLPVQRGGKTTAGYVVLHSLLLFLVSPLLYIVGPLQETYLFASTAFGGIFLASSIRLWRRPTRGEAWTNYKLSGIYLLGLFLAMLADVLV